MMSATYRAASTAMLARRAAVNLTSKRAMGSAESFVSDKAFCVVTMYWNDFTVFIFDATLAFCTEPTSKPNFGSRSLFL